MPRLVSLSRRPSSFHKSDRRLLLANDLERRDPISYASSMNVRRSTKRQGPELWLLLALANGVAALAEVAVSSQAVP